MKKTKLFLIIFALLVFITAYSYAYSSQTLDSETKFVQWVFIEEVGGIYIPIWAGTTIHSNISQNYIIAGQYIGFHECSIFAY